MAEDIGSIHGQIDLDVRGAMAAYTSMRQQHLSTISALSQATGTLTSLGTGFLSFGTMVAGAFVGAGMAYGEFERKLDYFGAVSDASASDMAKLTDMVLDLGAKTIYTNDQIADGFTELAKAGVSAESILGGIGEGVTNLGAAADIGLDKAATMMMSVVATWGMAETEASRVADVLAGTANSSMVEIEDLGVSMKYAGGVAASLGISFDDVSTALGILGQRSIKGSTAGTSLRQIMIGLTGNTNKATKEMERLGIITADGTNQFFNADGSVKSLAEAMEVLGTATEGMGEEQRIASLKTMFNVRAMPSLLALLDSGTAGFDKMASAIQGVSAADVAASRLDNLSGDMEYLRGEVDNLILSFGSLTQGTLRTVVQAIEGLVAWFNGLSDETKNIVITVGLVAAGMALMGGSFLLAAGLGTNLVYQIVVIRQALVQLGGVATVVSRIMAMLFRPPVVIFLIIAAVAALAAGLAFFFTQTEAGRAAWASISAAFANFMAGPGSQILAVLTQLAGVVGGFLAQAFTSIAGVIGTVASGFSSAAGGVGSLLSSGLGVVAQLFTTVGNVLMSLIMPIVQQLAPIFMEFGNAIAGVSSNMTGMAGFADMFGQILAAVINMAAQLVVVFIELGVQLLTAVIGMLPTIITGFVTLFTTILTTVVGMLPQIVTALVSGLTGIITGITAVLPMIIQAVITLLLAIVTALVGAIPQLIQAALQLFTGLLTGLTQALPLIIQGLVAAIPLVIQALVSALPLLIAGAIQLFLGLVEALTIIIPQVITALAEAIPQILTALVDAIPLLLDAAIQAFMAIVEAIPQIIPPLLTALVELIPVIIETVIGMIPTLIEAAIQLFMAIVEAVPQIISSLIPAIIDLIPVIIETVISLIPQLIEAAVQLFMAIVEAIPQIVGAIVDALWTLGEQMIQGLVDGLVAMGPAVLDAIGGVVDGAIGWAKDLLGIKSPSRVFRSIGDYLGKGFIQGINKNKSGVEKATKGLVDASTKAYRKLRDELEKENKKLDKLYARINNGEWNWKIEQETNATYANIQKLKKALNTEASVNKRIAESNKKLLALTAQRDKVTKKLDDARKNLEDALKEQADFRTGYSTSIQDRGSISELKTTDGMIYNLEQQVAKTQEFKKLYDQLKKRGLDKKSLEELAMEFAETGSISAAQALAGGSDAELKRIADLRSKLKSESETMANQITKDFHTAGVEAARGIVKGLESQLANINKSAKKIADELTKAVKKQLGIKSPSRVFADIGDQTMIGLVNGLARSESDAQKQLNSMAATMTDFYDKVFAARQFELETMMTMKATEQAAANPLIHKRSSNSEMAATLAELKTILSNNGSNAPQEVNHFGDILIKDIGTIKDLEAFIEMVKVYKKQKQGIPG